jgi:hypothetical protein
MWEIRNGELAAVPCVMKDGRIRVRDDAGVDDDGVACKTLAASRRMFVSGYAVTTHASQGKIPRGGAIATMRAARLSALPQRGVCDAAYA